MKKRLLFVVIMIGGFILASFIQEISIDALLRDFKSNDWPTVLDAKEKLENMEEKSIPDLINMLGVKSFVKLTNTGDLIYPGAEKFYGRGQIIEYDIDDMIVRAGWLLEEITFQNFGFSGVHIQEDRLINFIKINFPGYYNDPGNRKKLDKCSVPEKRRIIKDLSVKEAKEWWDEESGRWNRLDALVDALKSDDEKRQVKALFYLRNGKTKCTGLTEEYYEDNIKSIVLELSKVQTKRVSEHAKLILLDVNYEWLKIKQI
jgi:hypothetical protein